MKRCGSRPGNSRSYELTPTGSRKVYDLSTAIELIAHFLPQNVDTDRERRDLIRQLLCISIGVVVPAIGLGLLVDQLLSCDIAFVAAWQALLLAIAVDLAVLRRFRAALGMVAIIAVGVSMVAAFIYWGRTDWTDLNLIVVGAQVYLSVR